MRTIRAGKVLVSGAVPGPAATRVRLAGLGGVLLLVLLQLAVGGGTRGVLFLGVAALVAGVLAALVPGSPLVAITLLLLLTQHVDATSGRGWVVRLVAAVVTAALLWAVHAVNALAAAIPGGAVVDPVVLHRVLARVGQVLGLSLPVGVLAAGAGALAPEQHWISLVGAAATAGTLLLLVVLRRTLRADVQES